MGFRIIPRIIPESCLKFPNSEPWYIYKIRTCVLWVLFFATIRHGIHYASNKDRASDPGDLLKLGFLKLGTHGTKGWKEDVFRMKMCSGSLWFRTYCMLACFSDNRLTGWQKPKAHNVRLTWHGTRYATHIVSEAQWYSDPHQVSSYILRFYLAYFLIFWRMFSYIMWDMFWYVSAHVFWHVHRILCAIFLPSLKHFARHSLVPFFLASYLIRQFPWHLNMTFSLTCFALLVSYLTCYLHAIWRFIWHSVWHFIWIFNWPALILLFGTVCGWPFLWFSAWHFFAIIHLRFILQSARPVFLTQKQALHQNPPSAKNQTP